jgi:CheY-like chemotaxis protein
MTQVHSLPRSGIRAVTSKRVLIVDDDEDFGEMLLILLEGIGHEAKAVWSADHALELAATFRPHVTFIDIGMPIIDGYALVGLLRSIEELKDCRFVAATGYGGQAAVARSLAAGFHEHITKPLSFEAVAAALSGSRELEPAAR